MNMRATSTPKLSSGKSCISRIDVPRAYLTAKH